MKKIHAVVISTPLLCVLGAGAHAADECSDVLLHPLFDVAEYKRDSYVSTTILANLDSANDSSSSSSSNFSIPIQGLPIGLGFQDAQRVRSTLSQHYDFDTTQKESVSVLLMSGQEKILDAWRDCVSSKSGVGLRFEPLDGNKGKNTFLHIEYFGSLQPGKPNPKPLAIVNDVYIDPNDAKVVSGADCLKAGNELAPGSSCTVQLILNDPWTVLPVVFQFTNPDTSFSKYAYLAPRAQLKGKSKPWSGASGVYVFDNSKWDEWRCATADEGFVFVEKSIQESGTPGGMAVGRDSCKVEHKLDATGTNLCVRAGIIGVPASGDWYCNGKFTAAQAAVYWDPPAK
ncbi:hypothetical protein [Rhizobium sp. BK068]|uniref:hypothetical protein n=1 Tax=Rhizobium sp. BK068 TaxID=2512130 RepID=UPI001045B003|nr:hypothetical protein [Rhizobium sp. BK068]TCM62369.1 hypothetical protein EV291_15314 [Rhizobium sp. BK068]